MTKFDNKFVPSTPKTYEVKYVENKPSGLSPAARSKVVNRSGSNYLSKNQGGFGPMETEKVEVARNKGCSNPSTFEVNTVLTGDYFFGRGGSSMGDVFSVASGKVKDQDFSRIQKRIDELKSGKLKVYKYKDSSKNRNNSERTEECIKYEGYFETKLEETIKELKEKTPHYGSMCHGFNFTRP